MVTTKMNWSGPNVIHFGRKSQFGPDQFILVVTISFWSRPNHNGQVQIELVRPKPFWTDQNCFGHIEGQGISHLLLTSLIFISTHEGMYRERHHVFLTSDSFYFYTWTCRERYHVFLTSTLEKYLKVQVLLGSKSPLDVLWLNMVEVHGRGEVFNNIKHE